MIQYFKLICKDFLWSIKNNKLLKKTFKIKNSKKKKKIFIFGNGNSINLLKEEKIKKYLDNDFEILCMNNFILSKFADKINIDYYLIADKRVYFPDKSNFSNEKKTEILNMHKKVKERKIKLFLPTDFSSTPLFPNETFYFNNNFNPVSKNYIDITKYNNLSSLSGIKAIMIAIYMGFSEIYICGIDNNQWKYSKVDKDNNILSDSLYFNKEKNIHINKEKKMSNYLKIYSDIFKSYESFKDFKIINLDKDSFINCFEKKHNLDVYK